MKKIVLGFVAFGLMALVTLSANAQFPGGGRGGLGAAMLVGNKSVQEELRITDEQKEKLSARRKDFEPKMAEVFAKLKEVPKEEQKEKMGEMMKMFNETAQKEINLILTKDQQKRLKQIEIQQQGVGAFSDETVSKELKITPEQKEKIASINAEMAKDMVELRGMMKDDKTGAMKKLVNLRKENMEKAVALMTDDQKKTYKTMTGDTFELKLDGGRGGFGKKKDD